MPTLKSPQSLHTPATTGHSKSWPQYTRISLNAKLQTTVAQVQQELPLFSTNDVINFLISKGYQHWLQEHPQYAQLKPKTQVISSVSSLIDDENLYSPADGEATQFE